MNQHLSEEVWRRANHACEYCRLPQAYYPVPFEIDHIIARQHGGSTILSNLALSCFPCNCHKGPNIAGIDRVTSSTKLVRLFHPRRHKWDYHFEWDGARLIGKTPIGRVTVNILAINDPGMMELRRELIREGVFPAEAV